MNTNASQSVGKTLQGMSEIGETPGQTLSHQKFYHHLQSSPIHHHPLRDIEEGKRFNIWVSLLVRIVNLVLLDGRIHVTHKSGFVWTMDKKSWMERAGNEGKFAFVTLLCLSCSQYWATELSSRLSYPPPRPPHTEHNSVWLHKIVIIRLSVHFFGHANPQFSCRVWRKRLA